jgi:DNA-binding NarL/FixJ family response regulator
LLHALADQARGGVLLAGGDPKAALALLRQAQAAWQELEAPYDVARVRALIAAACGSMGDSDAAALEYAAARRVFLELGAAPDLDRMARLAKVPAERPGGLTDREAEVLRLLAGGRSNRAIATDLGISERTVDRHVSNIYTKLDVSSRSAATAFAYEHGLT